MATGWLVLGALVLWYVAGGIVLARLDVLLDGRVDNWLAPQRRGGLRPNGLVFDVLATVAVMCWPGWLFMYWWDNRRTP